MITWARALRLIESITHDAGLPIDQVRRVAKRRMRSVLARDWEGQANREAIIAAVRSGEGVGTGAPELEPTLCRACDRRHIAGVGCPLDDPGPLTPERN